MSKRLWCVALALGLLGAAASGCGSCGGSGGSEGEDKSGEEQGEGGSEGRLVILGFDGVDPDWVDEWGAEGKLPTLTDLIEAQDGAGYRRLGSTNPPQSPVAWNSFATGTEPGDHGIFDFIRRKLMDRPSGPPLLPSMGTTEFEVQEVGPPSARNLRNGVPFWKRLSDAGIGVQVINVPYSFPPDPMKKGRMLSGLGVPDLRGTNSTFAYVGTDVTPEEAKDPPGGGVLVPLEMSGDTGTFELEGPKIAGTRERMAIEVEVRTNPVLDDADSEVREAASKRMAEGAAPPDGMIVAVQDQEVKLGPRQMSEWVELTFRHDGREIRGIARFMPLQVGEETRLFVTPTSFHPKDPWAPISYPGEYAGELADEIGLYKTVGWDHDTSALNAEMIDEEAFLSDMDRVEKDRREMLMKALERDDWRMLAWVSTSTDRVAHMFYRLIDPEHPMYDEELAKRFGNAIEREYERMDETIGLVLDELEEDDTLLVISDHGFHNFRRGLHLNQWLRQQGLLALEDGKEAADREFLMDVDWSQTKAYALGTGQIYLNLRGREREGIVSPGDADAVMKKVRDGLLALRDEDNDGKKVVREVYFGKNIWKGESSEKSPDIQVAFAETYRTSWETILGGVPAGLFADNDRKWSGDHAASDVETTAGILVSNRPLREDVDIVDLAPTAHAFFGDDPPERYPGESVLAESE